MFAILSHTDRAKPSYVTITTDFIRYYGPFRQLNLLPFILFPLV
jgi:hypothetical protein